MIEGSPITPETGVSIGLLVSLGAAFAAIIGWIMRNNSARAKDLADMRTVISDQSASLRAVIAEQAIRVAVVESRFSTLVSDMTEIKGDVKELLGRRE